MIFDLIENAEKYLGLHPNLDLALKNLDTPEALSGEKVKCNPAAYATIDPEKARFEVHRLYADIHIALEGAERIGYAPVQKLEFAEQVAADGFFYTGEADAEILLKPGSFLLVFPEEGHQLQMHPEQPSNVKKHVFKILMKEDGVCG